MFQSQPVFEEFDSFLTELNSRKEPILVCGDFIIHIQKSNDRNVRTFIDILTQYDLAQHVTDLTHVSGNTIDLIMSRNSDKISNSAETSSLVSDHFLVKASLDVSNNNHPPHSSQFFKLKSIDLDAFEKDIREKLQSAEDQPNLKSESNISNLPCALY